MQPSKPRTPGVLAVLLALFSLLSLIVVGCSSASSPSAPAPSRLPAATGGSVETTGYVVHEGPEGGFWALQDRPIGPSSQIQPKIVVVLLPGAVNEQQFAAAERSLVKVTGRYSDGVSIRNAGPELIVETISVISSDAPR
jgi:hypothetical protein